jgi:hypothetical protein
MSNVLDDDKQQQIRALGRLGWTLSRIQDATGTLAVVAAVVARVLACSTVPLRCVVAIS